MKAKRDFVERFEGMKLYVKGDEYTFKDDERVQYLKDNGYLEESKPQKADKKKSGD